MGRLPGYTMRCWLLLLPLCVAPAHAFAVKWDNFTIGGLIAGGSQQAIIYYPKESTQMKFPLLSFGHGYGAGGAGLQPYYHKLLQDVSSAGFVIVAAASCPTSFCTKSLSADMAHVLNVSKEVHPALEMVNRSAKLGMFGHSMGAFCTTRATVDARVGGKLGAAVYLHGGNPWPWGGASDVKVPVFSITGSADTTAPPAGTKLVWNEQSNAHPKAFANLLGALHNESVTTGRMNPFVAS